MRKIAIFVQSGVHESYIAAVTSALDYFLVIFSINHLFTVQVLRDWKLLNYQEGNRLVPFRSINWLLQQGYETRLLRSDKNLNTGDVLANMERINFENNFDRSILVTNYSLNHKISGYNFGTTRKHFCTAVSVVGLHCYNPKFAYEWLYYLSLHEIGHLFGLISRYNTKTILGKHCENSDCIMHEFTFLPDDLSSRVRTGYLAKDLKFCLGCVVETSQMRDELLSSHRTKI